MKGLLIKDIRLMKNMKNSLFIILLVAVGMSTYINDVSFLVVYLGLIGATFANSSISYDEFDNGYAFLFSLPVTRKGYVAEKYIFGMLLCGGGWLMGTVLAAGAGMARGEGTFSDIILASLMLLPAVMLLLAVMIPFHLKYNGEKGRIVMVVAMGGLFGIIVLASKIAEKMNIDLNALWERIPVMGAGVMAAGAVITGVIILLLSCRISMAIMEKKEF